jgi:hypothetical protein
MMDWQIGELPLKPRFGVAANSGDTYALTRSVKPPL